MFRKIFAFLVLLFMSSSCLAVITGVHGYEYDVSKQETICAGSSASGPSGYMIKGNACTISPIPGQYVPHSGYYKVALYLWGDTGISNEAVYFDQNIPISEQNASVTGADSRVFPQAPIQIGMCYQLIDETGAKFAITVEGGDYYSREWCGDATPAPPTPPQPPTSCTINNGNPLNVNLGTVDRAQMSISPGTGSIRHIQIPVECTGEVSGITTNMQLTYTPLTVNGSDVIQTSTNGLGITIMYDSKPLSPTDITPVTFNIGQNNLDIGFEVVRNPDVGVGGIATGAFTASAVLILTQQ